MAAVVAACSGQYKGMPRAEVLAYQTDATYGGLHTLATAYATAINAAVKEDTLHPGMYAEYAVTLALMGRNGEACRMFNAEMLTFPQSRAMVTRIKGRMLPAYMGDTTARLGDTADLAQLASWAYDSVSALQPVRPGVAPVIDSTDPVWIQQQTPVDSVNYPIRLTANQKREMLAQQQAQEKLALKHQQDSIAAAKQAKIDQRKQQQADRKKAKKEKEKAKKKAEKQRKQEAKAKKKQREMEREQQRKQREQEKREQEKQKKQNK